MHSERSYDATVTRPTGLDKAGARGKRRQRHFGLSIVYHWSSQRLRV